jgi:hypothetical protein
LVSVFEIAEQKLASAVAVSFFVARENQSYVPPKPPRSPLPACIAPADLDRQKWVIAKGERRTRIGKRLDERRLHGPSRISPLLEERQLC